MSRERVFSPRLYVCAHLRAAVARSRRRRCPGTPLWSVATAAHRVSRVCAAGPRAIIVYDIRVRARSQQQLVAASDNIYFRYDREGTETEPARARERERKSGGGGGGKKGERRKELCPRTAATQIAKVSVGARPRQPA